jgi:hypothetical protein
MILRFLFFAFLFYLAYKLVFGFIIPVYRTTRQVRKGFREMHQKMQGTDPYRQNPGPEPKAPENKSAKEDYIDFEEVK